MLEFECIYTGPVDMFLTKLIEINQVVFSPGLSTDIQHFLKNIFELNEPQNLYFHLNPLIFFYDHYIFFYTSVCENV